MRTGSVEPAGKISHRLYLRHHQRSPFVRKVDFWDSFQTRQIMIVRLVLQSQCASSHVTTNWGSILNSCWTEAHEESRRQSRASKNIIVMPSKFIMFLKLSIMFSLIKHMWFWTLLKEDLSQCELQNKGASYDYFFWWVIVLKTS